MSVMRNEDFLVRRFMNAAAQDAAEKADLAFYFTKKMKGPQICKDWREQLEKIIGRKVTFVGGGTLTPPADGAGFMLAVNIEGGAPVPHKLADRKEFADWCRNSLHLWQMAHIISPKGSYVFRNGDPGQMISTSGIFTAQKMKLSESEAKAAKMQGAERMVTELRLSLARQLETVQRLGTAFNLAKVKHLRQEDLSETELAKLDELVRTLRSEELKISPHRGFLLSLIGAMLQDQSRESLKPEPGPS